MSSPITSDRILHIGDMAYVGYRIVKLLRNNNIPADYLYYENPYLRDSKEPWIHFFNTSPSDRFNKPIIFMQSLSIIPKYNVIHAHSIFAVPLLLSPKPFILHLHGTDVRVYAKEKTLLGWMLRKLIHKANIILVSTPDLISEVKHFGRNPIYLPNPIDFDVFKPYKSKIELHRGTETVLFHPTHHSITKGNDVIIRTVSSLIREGYSIKLVMVEWGSMLEESKNLVRELGIENFVVWIPKIPPNKMADYYNASDIVCDQFSIGELGLTSLEAMACGKPVITKYDSNDSSSDNQKEYVLPKMVDYFDVKKELIRLLEDPTLRKDVGRNNYEWVKTKCCSKTLLTTLIQCYASLNYRR